MRAPTGAGCALLAMTLLSSSSFAIEPLGRMRESVNPNGPAGAPPPCPLIPNRDGTCANYKWYNLCSGYIWLFSTPNLGEAVGVSFGGPSQPCVAPGKSVKRGIYYFRNVIPNYGQFMDLYLDEDCDNDGCPEGILGSALNFDPGLRWNCVNYGVCIPCGGLILREVGHGGIAPTIVTDGPFKTACDPAHPPTHSYYYGINGRTCVPWVGVPATAPDDFLMWLIVDDGCVTATRETSWGSIKGLYR